VRYAVVLPDGTWVGFVNLPDPPVRRATVRVQPLPAFRVARKARRLYRRFGRARAEHARLTHEDMVIEEQALAGFCALELRLAEWPSGVLVPNASVRLLPGEPPLGRVQFRGPEEATSEQGQPRPNVGCS
jgi:hypothetical protein